MCLVRELRNMKPQVHIADDETELIENVQEYIADRLAYLLEQNGTISIGVSGGSMPKIFTKAILGIPNLNWKRIRIFMVDERNVDPSDQDSNQAEYLRLFPDELREVIVPVPIYERDVRKTAIAYELNLRKYLLPEMFNSTARFDMIFLGVGPDGHTASIFPGRERFEKITEYHWVAAIVDSPKYPPVRVTLTQNCINNAKNVAFIIQGKPKAHIVRAMLDKDFQYPASTIRPLNEKLDYFLDTESASALPSTEMDSSSSPEPDSPPPFTD